MSLLAARVAKFVNQSVHLTITIAADHPSLPGHFPGRPVVPGAVILAEIVHASTSLLSATGIAGFPSVKFVSPMLPEQTCQLTLIDQGAGAASFELTHEGRRVASGELRYQRNATES